jgi:hypothetical protein
VEDRTSPADRIVERHPIGEHDGASGALLERATLDDGTRVVLKTFDPLRDLSMVIARRQVPADVELWQSGVLDRLPSTIGHAIRGAWQEDGRWVLAMSDLSESLLSYESRLTRGQCRQVMAAAAALHQATRGGRMPSLWTVEERVAVFSPRVMNAHAQGENPLPGWCLQGWAAWEELAPPDVRALVARIHEHPEVLTGPLRRLGPEALLHGDFWTPNLALEQERIVAIDWALATVGPPVLEFASFLVGCAAQVDATPEEILDDLRAVSGPAHDEALLRLGLVFGVVEMGWNLAWHLKSRPSPEPRAVFDWWIEAARRGAATGWLG